MRLLGNYEGGNRRTDNNLIRGFVKKKNPNTPFIGRFQITYKKISNDYYVDCFGLNNETIICWRWYGIYEKAHYSKEGPLYFMQIEFGAEPGTDDDIIGTIW